jgi:histidine triad (HIT) family protein
VLVIPRRHVATLNDVTPADDVVLGRLVRAGARIARDRGVADGGYRLVLNCNADAGQSVWHVHLHVLGGRSLSWPPG